MNNKIFINQDFWCKYGLTPDYVGRINVIKNLLPTDITSLLDIGCGKAEIISYIKSINKKIKVTGIDLQRIKNSHDNIPFMKAALPNIPLTDKSYDLVMCLEVLEHIEEKDYLSSLRELERLSKKYIIVGVPYKENLMEKEVICNRCFKTSNTDGHLRNFNYKKLSIMFSSFKISKFILCGVLRKRRSKIYTYIMHKLPKLYDKPKLFSCPYCGFSKTKIYKNNFWTRKIWVLINKVLNFNNKTVPYWSICLYNKND